VTQYFDDFAANTTGNSPTGWTHFEQTGDWALTVQEDVTAIGGKYLRIARTSTGSDENYAVHDASNAASGAVELYTRWRIRSGEVNTVEFLPILCIFVHATDESCYALTWRGATVRWDIIRIGSSGGIAASLGNATPLTPAVGTWYKARFQRDTDGVFRGKVWADGDAEPGSWAITSAINTTITTGGLGVGAEDHTCEPDYNLVGIGTGGDAAPTSAPGGGGFLAAWASNSNQVIR
jgi:hypothetical protein